MTQARSKESLLVLTAAFPGRIQPYRALTVKRAAETLANRFHIHILCPKIFSEDPAHENLNKISVTQFPFLSGEKILKHYSTLPLLRIITYFISGLFHTLQICRRAKPVAIYANWVIPAGVFALAASRILKIPYVLHALGSDINVYAKRNVLFKMLTHSVLKHSFHILTASESLRQEVINSFATAPQKVSVCRPTIDTELFIPGDRAKARESLNLPQESKIALYVGDITAAKGCQLLYEAAEKITSLYPDTLFIFLGDGPLLGSLISRSKKSDLSDRILFAGSVPNSTVAQFMHSSDVFVLPSFSEGTPVSLLEALACGLPVIATRVGGIPELIQSGENGLLITPGNSEELFLSLQRILSESELREKLSQEAKKYSAHNETQTLLTLFENLPRPKKKQTPFHERFYLRKHHHKFYARAHTRAKIAAKLLGDMRGKILDAGCGRGILLSHLRESGIAAQGVDISETAIRLARKDGLSASVLDIEKDEIYGDFDAIFCLEVLEHIRNPFSVLRKLSRHLEKSGILILSLPNQFNLWSRIKIIFGSDGTGHLHSFDRRKARKLIRQSGLQIEKEESVPLLAGKFPFGIFLFRLFPALFTISYFFSLHPSQR
jgi:glycosyltransferase involved in cell wall biosynthesis/SAM-dependent methyltransferase